MCWDGENTTATVWNGKFLSKYVESTSDLRQGCILSPLLFALFIDDLEEEFIGDGADIEGLNVRKLAVSFIVHSFI